jgi:hypothetical protein
LNKHLCVFWGYHFFHWRSFDDPMNEVSDIAPLFMAPLICVKALVKIPVNLVSCLDSTLTCAFGERSFIDALWYISSALLKTLHPCGFHL